MGETRRGGERAGADRHRKPLDGDRAAVLQAGEAYVADRAAQALRQFLCDPAGIRIALGDLQQQRRAATIRRKAQVLLDHEILGHGAQRSARLRLAPGTRRRQRQLPPLLEDQSCATVRSSTTAWAARPSPPPRNPIFSVVGALTFTQSGGSS